MSDEPVLPEDPAGLITQANRKLDDVLKGIVRAFASQDITYVLDEVIQQRVKEMLLSGLDWDFDLYTVRELPCQFIWHEGVTAFEETISLVKVAFCTLGSERSDRRVMLYIHRESPAGRLHFIFSRVLLK